MITYATPQTRLRSMRGNVHVLSPQVTSPMVCEACGSTHFVQASAEEFTNNGYGSAEFRPLTGNFQPPSVYVCLCGTPMPVNGLSLAADVQYSNTPKGRFLASLQKAIAFRQAHQPQVLAQGCVSPAEHEELRDKVAVHLDQIDGLFAAVEALERANDDDTDKDI